MRKLLFRLGFCLALMALLVGCIHIIHKIEDMTRGHGDHRRPEDHMGHRDHRGNRDHMDRDDRMGPDDHIEDEAHDEDSVDGTLGLPDALDEEDEAHDEDSDKDAPHDEDKDEVHEDEVHRPVTFVVIGDMPYSEEEDAALTAPDGDFVKAIQAINPPVLVHYGDLKGGGEDCTDELLTTRQVQVAELHPHKVVFTPGDNDWTDCDRDFLTTRFDELERLAFIRTLFYEGAGLDMTRDIPDLVRQAGLPENAMWQIDNLVMGTLHLVGTNNGRDDIQLSDEAVALDMVDERDALNLAWLEQLFEAAKDADGLVIIFQADIYRPGYDENPACTADNRVECDAFAPIRAAIETMTLTYGKPVLALHGDTNAYCFNQPSEAAINLWHLNGPGDFKFSDAAQVTFDSSAAEPFQVTGVLGVVDIPPAVCDYSR